MGLDMYLERRAAGAGESANTEEVFYWRKANHIRRWIIDHTGYCDEDNCVYYVLTKADLEQLLKDCKAVKEDHSLAESVLPTMDGFFFGSTDYDKWYFDDINNTIDGLETILDETDFDKEEICYYEWY